MTIELTITRRRLTLAGGREVARADAGYGRRLLLLPALSSISTLQEMEPLQQQLAEHYATTAFDWPGFGGVNKAPRHPSPDQLQFFVNRILGEIGPAPYACLAAGHAAGYLLEAAARHPERCGRLILVAPTWRGPLPTMLGRRPGVASGIARAVDLPGIGQLLYRLNVNKSMIRFMARQHVYSDGNWLRGRRFARKRAVTRAPGARHGSIRFVTGLLDPMESREAFLRTAAAVQGPILMIYGAETPARSRAEMEALSELPNVRALVLPRGKLAIHEEFAEEVAAVVRDFLA